MGVHGSNPRVGAQRSLAMTAGFVRPTTRNIVCVKTLRQVELADWGKGARYGSAAIATTATAAASQPPTAASGSGGSLEIIELQQQIERLVEMRTLLTMHHADARALGQCHFGAFSSRGDGRGARTRAPRNCARSIARREVFLGPPAGRYWG